MKNSFFYKKNAHLFHSWFGKGFYGTDVNRALSSLHWGSLEITFTVPLTGNCLHIYLTREMNQYLSPQRLTSPPINLNINLQPITILLCWPIPRLLNLTPWELWTFWREKPRPRPRQLRREYHQASSRLCQVNILNSILGFLFFLS